MEADGRPDVDVADETWAKHKARNDSIISDLFQFQFKSTVICPDCGKVSITFDPGMYLSLPVIDKQERTITLKFFPKDPTRANTKVQPPPGL